MRVFRTAYVIIVRVACMILALRICVSALRMDSRLCVRLCDCAYSRPVETPGSTPDSRVISPRRRAFFRPPCQRRIFTSAVARRRLALSLLVACHRLGSHTGAAAMVSESRIQQSRGGLACAQWETVHRHRRHLVCRFLINISAIWPYLHWRAHPVPPRAILPVPPGPYC